MATTATATDVENAYLAYFGRPADPEGMNYWIGKSIATMQAGFAASQEYQNLYGGMTNTQVVTQVYQNLLGRAPDAGGLAYWVNQMNLGAATVATIVTQMQANAEGVDIATLANRFVFAIHFTEDLTSQSQIAGYSGTAAANAARIAVSQVTNTSSSLATAESNMALDIQAVDNGESPVALAAANAAAAATAATNASNLASYGSIDGVTQPSAANTFALSSGSNTVTMVVGSSAVTDTFTNTSAPTSLIVNVSGSSTGALGIAAFTNNSLTSATFNNTSASALTVSGITDTALATLTIGGGSGTGSEAITVINDAASTLTIHGNNFSTGGATVTLTSPTVATLNVYAGGDNLVIAPFADNSLTNLTLGNGSGTAYSLTLDGLTDSSNLVLNILGYAGPVNENALTLTGTSFTVNDSSNANQSLVAFTDNNLTSLTLNNTPAIGPSALLTASGITSGATGTVTVADTGTEAVTINSLTLSGAGNHTISNSGAGLLTIGSLSDSTGANILAISSSGAGGILDSADTTTAGTVTFTNSGGGTITESNMTANVATAINLVNGVTGTIGDSSASAVTVLGSGDNSALTLNITGNGANTITVGNGGNTITTGTGANTVTSGTGNDTINLGAGGGGSTVNGGGGTDQINLSASHITADTVYLVPGAIENITGFGGSGTVADLLNVTHTGNVLSGATLVNETALATGNANLAATSGDVFLKADGGTALTVTTAAALFSTTSSNAGTWNIANSAASSHVLIETGSSATSDIVWEINVANAGAITAVKIATIGVVSGHDIAFANIA